MKLSAEMEGGDGGVGKREKRKREREEKKESRNTNIEHHGGFREDSTVSAPRRK